MDFTHELGGRILVLPIRGAGPGSISLSKYIRIHYRPFLWRVGSNVPCRVLADVVTRHYLKYTPKTRKDGKVYWDMQEYTVKFEPKDISMDFQGLFSGEGGRLGKLL